MPDPRTLKLGKREPKLDDRTLRFDRYLTIPPLIEAAAPARLHLERAVPMWPIYGNDRYGDCVFADIGHQVEAWTANAGTEQSVSDAVQRMTWGFFNRYVDEAYAALSPDWIVVATQRSPEGVDWATLQADLATVG